MRFTRVALRAPESHLAQIGRFYGSQLGFELLTGTHGRVSFSIGETELEFLADSNEPFYHFALLVPGDRFGAALDWAQERAELLPDPGTGDALFAFDSWAAQACYFHDPAGNIVELIAHRGIEETQRQGPFRGAELVGLSELGLVGDTPAMAQALERHLGLELWDGTVAEPDRVAFIGEKARTLILSPEGRGWLPTGRPAELHEIDALLGNDRDGEVLLEGSRYRIRQR